MVGRGAQGRPWFPGQLAHYLTTGERNASPPLNKQFAWVSELYDEILAHYGVDIGVRHARKHLGWALDSAAAAAGAPLPLLKTHRSIVLTCTNPVLARRRLTEAFDAFGGSPRALRSAA
jgi:tRNA-dihydrouridine synthase